MWRNINNSVFVKAKYYCAQLHSSFIFSQIGLMTTCKADPRSTGTFSIQKPVNATSCSVFLCGNVDINVRDEDGTYIYLFEETECSSNEESKSGFLLLLLLFPSCF